MLQCPQVQLVGINAILEKKVSHNLVLFLIVMFWHLKKHFWVGHDKTPHYITGLIKTEPLQNYKVAEFISRMMLMTTGLSDAYCSIWS